MAKLTNDGALEDLLAKARRAPFFELVSALERLFPGSARVGTAGPFREEAVRFLHDGSMGYPASDLRAARLTDSGEQVEVVTTFLGMTGSATPLPLYFAEEIAREDPDDSCKGAFLDLFHHRLLSLLYRGLADLSYPHAYEAQHADPITECVVSLTGMLPGVADGDGFARKLHLRYASLLLTAPGSAETLERVLADELEDELRGASVRVECLVGERVELAAGVQARLGRNTHLGSDFLIGARIRDRASKLRVCIGPLGAEAYGALLPGRPGFTRARRVIDALLRSPIAYDFEFELEAGCGAGFRLAQDRLGQMTWLGASRAGTRVRIAGVRDSCA